MNNPKEEVTFLMIKPDGVKKGLVGEIIKRLEQRELKIVRLEMCEPSADQIDAHYPKDETWLARLGGKSLANFTKYGYDPIAEVGTDDPLAVGKIIRGWILEYMTSGPVVKMVVQGVHAIDMVRKIVGPTLPVNAEMGTIRGDFSIDSPALAAKEKRSVMNLAHASETPEEVANEIKLWFGDNKTFDYKRFGVDN